MTCRLLLFIVLLSYNCLAQFPVISTVSRHVTPEPPAQDTVEIPYPFFANSVDTDSIRTEWIDIGADNYVLESDDNDDFSSPTTEYSGTNTSFTLTGLSPGDKYYFRLKAQTAGLVDSPYAIDTCATFPFIPVAHYEFSGLDIADNRYGDFASGALYNYIYSVINYSGIDLIPGGSGFGGINFIGDNWTAYPNYPTAHATLTAPYVLDDFEINIAVKLSGTFNNNEIVDNSLDAQQYIRHGTYSTIRFNKTTGVTLTLDNALEDGEFYYISYQRSGTTFTVRVQDVNGVVQTKSGTCPSTQITFNRVFNTGVNYYMTRMSVSDHVLSTGERDSVINYLSRKVFVPEEKDITIVPKGLTFSDFSTSPYLVNSEFPAIVSSSYLRDKYFGYGDYSFVNVSKKYEAPTYGEDLIYVFNDRENTVSAPIAMGVPGGTSTDVHNTGGICHWNNLLVFFEQNRHYSDGPNYLVVKMFGKNMNMVSYKEIPLSKGIASYDCVNTQYHQVNIINDKIYIVAQEWSGSAGNTARRIVLLISDNEWTFFRKYYILESNEGDGDFMYANLLYSEDKLIITAEHEVQPGNDHRASYILVGYPSVNETTFHNVAGTFSKNVGTSGPLTLTELDANYLLGTAITGSPGDLTSVKQSHGLYDPATNEAYVVRFNGSDDGLVLDEVDFTAETITEYAIPETIDGHTVDVSCVGSGATNQPFVYKEGSTYYAVVGEVNGDNTKII